jgi:hypothetical protein
LVPRNSEWRPLPPPLKGEEEQRTQSNSEISKIPE